MPEFNFDEPKAVTAEVPRYSPEDITEEQASEVIDVSPDEVMFEDMIEFNEPISEDAINASIIRDELVRSRYTQSAEIIETTSNYAQSNHDKIVNDALKSIEDSEIEYAEWYEQQETAKRLTIQAIEEQFIRNVQHAYIDKTSRIDSSNKIIDDADGLLDSNKRAIANLQRVVEGGIKAQAQHEKNRNRAVETINNLAIEFTQKQADLSRTEAELDKYNVDLFNSEARKDELIDEENTLKAKERTERERLAEPYIRELRNRYATTAESSETIKEHIKSFKKGVMSQDLRDILGKLTDIHEKQQRNKRTIDNNISLVAATELAIEKLKERIEEIPQQIEIAHRAFAVQLETVSPSLEDHSKDSVNVTQTFYAINQGDTTAVAGEAIPAILRPVWVSMGAMQKALTKSNEAAEEIEWPDDRYDTTILAPLYDQDASGEAHEVSDISALTENRERFTQELEDISKVDIVSKIRRGLVKAGQNISYQLNQGQQPKE
jgi:hypothetical protein